MTIDKAIQTITLQMEVSEFRERTSRLQPSHEYFCRMTGAKYQNEITQETTYLWHESI